MKLTKEDVYISLRGKSKEELTEIQNVLIMFNEPTYRKDFKTYYNIDSYNYLEFYDGKWLGSRTISENKQEVTIEQLKEIIKPMETKFTPIAMRCTQEQFEAIKPKLKGLRVENISSFNECNYLANNLGGQEKLISNVTNCAKGDYHRIVHEEWNEEVFLKFCGIEVETIEQTELLNNKPMVDLMGYSVLVDNEEQARKLQEIAFEQGFEWIDGVGGIRILGERSFQFGYNGEKTITFTPNGRHYQNKYVTKKAHFNDLFKKETLQEKAIRLENELKEVKQQIEDSKNKVGSWCKFWDNNKDEFVIGKLQMNIFDTYTTSGKNFLNCENITDSVLLESLNSLFKH